MVAGGGVGAFAFAYGRAGQLARITYPNGMVATRGYTEAGVPVSLDYAQGEDPVASFSATVDVDGRTVAQASTGSAQEFTFDDLGRLTKTLDWRGGECVTRAYGFDAASNRTSATTYGPGDEGVCQQASASMDGALGYDDAGRIQATGYSYDTLGRTLTLPALDTNAPASNGIIAAYAVDDMVASLSQTTVVDDTVSPVVESTAVMTYGLDPARRVNMITTKTDGVETQRLRYRFADETDSPAIVETSTDAGATWTPTRYVSLPALGMAASVTSGTVSLQVANLHGDVVASVSGTTGTIVLDSWNETDEYGNHVDQGDGDGASMVPARYGYLGTHQRATDTPTSGLTLMGARLYNPATGTFLSTDPVPGGNATPYSYPQSPTNSTDVSGRSSSSCDKTANCSGMLKVCIRWNPTGCPRAMILIRYALSYSMTQGIPYNRSNAGRHFVFMIISMRFFGEQGAIAMGNTHEKYASGVDHLVDVKNNAYARGWYLRHRRWADNQIGWYFSKADVRAMFRHGVSLFKRGYMWGLCHGRVSKGRC